MVKTQRVTTHSRLIRISIWHALGYFKELLSTRGTIHCDDSVLCGTHA